MTQNKKEKENIRIVAIDDGYAQTKLVGECPKTGKIIKANVRSSIRSGIDGGLSGISGGGVSSYKTEEGEKFTVSTDIESDDTQFDGFHTSQMNRVLVNHTMLRSGYSGVTVQLMTGLPVADFFLDDEKDESHIQEKRENLLKKLTSNTGEIMPAIKDVRVGCQAVAAWFDYVLDDKLEQMNDASGRVAIVDIGGRTTDIAVVVGGNAIDHSISGTENIGVLDVYNALGKEIRKRFGIKEKFPIEYLDSAVRTGKIKLWNKDNDVEEIVREIVLGQEGKIARKVEQKLGTAASLSAVVFVGGGAELFRSISSHFPNGYIPESPEFSNARGLYKYAKIGK
jgi:plasmid segregation protein ParM